MKKKFNSSQMLKSSDDCGKFSKSVSYETLADGTATIGRDIKQTQRLVKGSANKPLTAVGTLTSLLCNSAKVVENILQMSLDLRSDNESEKSGKTEVYAGYRFCKTMRFLYKNLVDYLLQILPVFRLVKVICLVAVLSVAIISKSWADEETPVCMNYHGNTVTCIEKLADKNGNNSCGDNCTYKVIVENGEQVLHVYKIDISKPATIRRGAFSPTYYAGNQVLDATGSVLPLNNIMLDNDFENISSYAFAGSRAQIFSANGKFVFQDTGGYLAKGSTTFNGDILFIRNPYNAVLEGVNINGDVIFAEGLSNINGLSLNNTHIDGNIIIPSSIKQIGDRALSKSSITGQIYCASGVEACYNMVKAGCLSQLEATRRTTCLDSLESLFKANKFRVYPDGCAKLEANLKCTKCKSASFKLEDDGWCLRKIYTPAEAAEVLRDDDKNEVTITFKK